MPRAPAGGSASGLAARGATIRDSGGGVRRAFVGGSFALSVALGILVLHRLDVRPRTTDAIVTANTIQVAPEIVGRIAALNVKDDAVVRRGDVLFTIEPERYALTLAQ